MSQLKTKAVQYATSALASAAKNKRVPLNRSEINKVNIGCGLAVAPGWVNVDGSLNAWLAAKRPWMRALGYRLSGASQFYSADFYEDTLAKNRFVFQDINNGLPFEDASVDFVFSSHFVEHLSRQQAQALLKDCCRVLKPGGVLRVSVPDLEYAWELYRRGEKERMLHDYFFTDSETAFSRHRYAYDFELLSKAMREAGFSFVERCSYQDGKTPDLDVLDNRGEYSLFVEASHSDEL